MKRLIPLLFILLGCILLTGGAAALGAAFFYHPADVPGAFDWTPPLEQIDNHALAPTTVILPLTGMSPADALNAALDNAHIENALAIIAYDPDLDNATRIGALLQLGSRYAMAKQTRQAASCYQAAALLATLTPALADPAREDTYLQASAGLRAIGATDAARMITDQAYLVAQHSPALQHDARALRLRQVANAYTALGAGALGAQASNKADAALTDSTNDVTVTVRLPFSPAIGALPASGEVDRAMQARIAAAKQLADDLTNSPPKSAADWPSDSVSQLTSTLLAEDTARQAYYDQQIALAKDPTVQLALRRDQVDWLALKYRAARGAFGIDLVPDWSKNVTSIASDLSDAWNAVFQLQAQQAAALPAAQNPPVAVEDVARRQIIAARWGWLSGTNEQDLRDALATATQQQRDAKSPDLVVSPLTQNGKTIYLLVPDSLYGLNEKALPQ